MTTCPRGHASTDPDFCDVCGAAMAAAAPGPPPAEPAGPAGERAPAGEPCPVCGTAQVGHYCEECGYDFRAGTATDGPAPASREPSPATAPIWEAVIAADRDYYDQVIAQGGPDAERVAFPPYCPERSVPLLGTRVRIGRAGRSRDAAPELDLGLPPADPGVSHLHAVLLAADDGWTLVDLGSYNGTLVAGERLTANVAVPVEPGQRIHLGAWTAITLRRRDRSGPEARP